MIDATIHCRGVGSDVLDQAPSGKVWQVSAVAIRPKPKKRPGPRPNPQIKFKACRPRWCPGCKVNIVLTPCPACHVREWIKRRQATR